MVTLRARRPKMVRRQGPPFIIPCCDAQTALRFAFGAGLQIDAQTVLDYVRAHPILSKTQIVRHFTPFLLSHCKKLFVDTIWPIYRRCRFYRPRLPQPS
jgi:hypothetical protein